MTSRAPRRGMQRSWDDAGVLADLGCQGVNQREEAQDIPANRHVAVRAGQRKVPDKSTPMGATMDGLKHAKARIRGRGRTPASA